MFDKVNMTITRGGARPATVTGRGLAAGGGVGALSTESLFYFFVFPKLYFFPLPPVSMFKCFSDRSEVCWLALPSTNAYERVCVCVCVWVCVCELVCVYNKTSMFILVVVLQSLFDRTNKTRERERERESSKHVRVRVLFCDQQAYKCVWDRKNGRETSVYNR
jgi:hypothetical protein